MEKAQEKMERETKVACKDAIERAIAEKFDGMRLPKETAEEVIQEYGIERVNYVLANTIMHKNQNGRFSPDNKEWAKEIEPYAMWKNRDMGVDSHPAVLNGFINQTRRYIDREQERLQAERDIDRHEAEVFARVEGSEDMEPDVSEPEETVDTPLEPDIHMPVKEPEPQIDKMEDIKTGKDEVSFVLVFKLSRFGRNAADVLASLQVMQDFGVNLICVEDGIDSSKDAGKLMISVLSAVAEIERENIRIQTMEGRMQKAREGKWNGGFAPYGYEKQLRQCFANRDSIMADLDVIDYEDKHYRRRKSDLEERLYKTYDKIEEMEVSLVAAKTKKRSILSDKISGDNIYKALVFFDKMYDRMNEAERREFIEQLIEKVEVYDERQSNGQWLKAIEFNLPIIEHNMKLSLDNGDSVETIVLLSGKTPDK